jgi:hypothetical protein
LELPRSVFRFIQNRLFCRVTRLLYPGDPMTYRTAPGRPAMRARTTEKKRPNASMSWPFSPATRLVRIAHAVTASTCRPPLPQNQPSPPPLSPVHSAPSPRFFLQRTEPGRLHLLLVARAGAGWPGLATKDELLLLLLLSMILFNFSRISSIKLFFAVYSPTLGI